MLTQQKPPPVAMFMPASSYLSTNVSAATSSSNNTFNFTTTETAATDQSSPTLKEVQVPFREKPYFLTIDERGPRIMMDLNRYSYCLNWSSLNDEKKEKACVYIACQNLIKMDEKYTLKEDCREEGRRCQTRGFGRRKRK